MNLLKLPLACLLIISVTATVPVAAQQKRRAPDKTPSKTQAAPAPAPATPVTFDTLVAADTFRVYGEARGVGQLVRSTAAIDVLEPLLKLGGPPKEFTSLVSWLRTHADHLITSRLMVAAWPTETGLPDVIVAIEFSSSEEATKFESKLNSMLAKAFPPATPSTSPSPDKKTNQPQPASEATPPAPVPTYHLQRADSLLVISPKAFSIKTLRPKGSKLLSEDPNFRVAYNRFASDPIFVYVDVAGITKQGEERRKKAEEEWKKEVEAQKAAAEKQKAEAEQKGEEGEEGEQSEEEKAMELAVTAEPSPEVPAEPPKEPTDAEQLSNALSALRSSLFTVVPKLPAALGIGFTPDNESFDVRALMIDAPGETSDPIPFFSGLKLSEPVTPESAGVLPADSELVIMLALDFPFIQGIMSGIESTEASLELADTVPGGNFKMATPQPAVTTPLKTIERILKINVKDEVLPLLGSEVAVVMPMGEFGLFGPPSPGPRPMPAKDDEKAAAPPTPYIVISLRDREGMRRMMPKILEGFAGKAAAALAQTERREDTELVTIANMFAYAFVGNFLVLGMDAASTRHVVDFYLKGETLGANPQFRNYTRWQPRQVQAQLYLSPAFAESYISWANSPTAQITDEARAFLARVSTNPQPVTYSLSNDGLGAFHELHVPKSVIVTALAGIASASNPPETVKNERAAMGMLWSIYSAQLRYKEEKKSGFVSLDELLSAEMVSKEAIEASGYKFEVRVVSEGFEVSAVPVEYGKTGKLSFFMTSQTPMIRGGDHGGAPASASDPQVTY